MITSLRGHELPRASTSCAPSATAARSARRSGASADINAALGDADTAAEQFEESLTLFIEFGDPWWCVLVLESAAFLTAATGDAERAVRLLGAADTILEIIGVSLLGRFRDRHDLVLAETRSRLGEGDFEAVWDEGRRVPLSATVELLAAAQKT